MEGDRILRSILNQTRTSSVVKDVENYLKPIQKLGIKQPDVTALKKYHSFSLKLLRCSIQNFEAEETEVCYLTEACQNAVTCLETACSYFISREDSDLCQLERLIKLLYHFLLYLSKTSDIEKFMWYSKKTLKFCKLERYLNREQVLAVSEEEIVVIYSKIFEMHWKMTSQTSKCKPFPLNVLSLRMQGLCFLLNSTKDIIKFGKYFETTILSFIQEVKNQNVSLDGETENMLADILQSLKSYLVSCSNDGPAQMATVIYSILLSFKIALIHGTSKEYLESLETGNCSNKQKANICSLFLPLIDSFRTHRLLRKLSGSKLSKELCKQSNAITKYLQSFGIVHEGLLNSKLLIENPKITVMYDLVRALLSFPEKLCWEILVQLCKLVVYLKKHIDVLLKSICDEIKNNSNKQICDERKSRIFYTQWYSFACWCLQTIQMWLGKSEKSIGDVICPCIARSKWTKEDLFDNCFLIMDSASCMLTFMEDDKIDFKRSEYHWIGVSSYNLGIIAQNDIPLTRVIGFLQLSVSNLRKWLKNGQSDVLIKLQQSNLIIKQRILVGFMLKADLKDKALNIIADFILFLLSTNIIDMSREEVVTIIRDQVGVWINTKEAERVLSMEIEKASGASLNSYSLKLIIQCEMAELINRRSSSSIQDSKRLLDFVIAKFKGVDDVMVAQSMFDYLSLQDIDLQERISLCRKARSLLEEIVAKSDHPSSCKDLLALAYFSLGCCDQKAKFFKYSNSDIEVVRRTENDFEAKDSRNSDTDHAATGALDYIWSFDVALNIWTNLIQTAIKSKSKSTVEETFKSADRTSKCLFYMGSLYSIRHQHMKSIHAFYLSSLVMTVLDSSIDKDKLDLLVTASSESVRQLVDVFDLRSAIALFGKIPFQHGLDMHSTIELEVTKAIFLAKAGEFELARNILKKTLSSDWVNQKTQKSFFHKANALLAKALAVESPRTTSSDKDHPLVLAQEALKIFRNLVGMAFLSKDSTKRKDKQKKPCWDDVLDSGDSAPWIILARLLDCLHYIVQRYRFQGCIPEARCHIKEGLLLCEQFGLHERKLEFLIEEAEASLVSDETEKTEHCLNEIESYMGVFCGEDHVQNSLHTLPDHKDECGCYLCCNGFFAKIRLKHLLIQRSHAIFSPKETNSKQLQDDFIHDSIMKVELKTNLELAKLRSLLTADKVKKRKKVTFDDNTNIPIESELENAIKADVVSNLTTDDICCLLSLEYRIEFHCLKCYATPSCQKSILLKEIDLFMNEIRSLVFFPLITTSYRVSLAKLIQSRVGLYLSSEQGLPVINFAWFPRKVVSNPNLGNSVERSEGKDGSLDALKTNQNVTGRGRKQRGSRKRSRQKKKAEEADSVVESYDENNRQCSARLESEQALKSLVNLCHEALSYLVPNVHCLQIKILYQLLSIVSGNLCPIQSAYIEALSFARSLGQQLLVRKAKKARKDSKMEGKQTDSDNNLCDVTISLLDKANDSFSFQNHENLKQQLVDDLPKDWRICSIRLSTIGIKCLIITRFQACKDPIILRISIDDTDDIYDEDTAVGGLVRDLASAFVTDPLDEFEEIIDQSLQSLETEDVKAWWNNRKKLDKRLQKMLGKLENAWLGGWKGILLGDRKDFAHQSKIISIAEEFCEGIRAKYGLQLSRGTVEVLFDSYPLLDRMQVNRALKNLLGSHFMESIVESFVATADHFMDITTEKDRKSPPVKGRRARRKECRTDEVRRCPVILVLDERLQKIPWESMSMLRNQVVARMPSLLLTRLSFMTSGKFFTDGVDTESTFYVLNPRNDLQNTQKTFEKWFQSIQGWRGLSNRAPSEAEYKSALEDYDMFIYCGHGNGREFLRGDDIQRINCNALTFLIGCSSGKLQIKGSLDPRGMVLNYLTAGCPAIIANLWDVTDKDIDRFLSKILKQWLDNDANLLECMPIARDSCLLPYLIGASPVLFGLPVIMKKSKTLIHLK